MYDGESVPHCLMSCFFRPFAIKLNCVCRFSAITVRLKPTLDKKGVQLPHVHLRIAEREHCSMKEDITGRLAKVCTTQGLIIPA